MNLHAIYLSAIFIASYGYAPYSPTCADAPFNTYPYCDYKLSINERINDLYARLTLDEKNNITNSNQGGVLRLAVPPLQTNAGCIHGAAWPIGATKQSHPITQFPQGTTLAQSFNRKFYAQMGRSTSDEVRAVYNEAAGTEFDIGHGYGAVCWGPSVNVCRDPRWGRCQEAYGECPLLNAEYVKQYAYNLQYNAAEPDYWEVATTCKHFNVHTGPDSKSATHYGRASFDSIVRYDDWYLTFQPAFKACARVNVASFMCSYNEINGVPACGNSELLQDILRDEWQWDGFVVSDCGATPQIYSYQNYTRNFIEAAQVAIKAGTDWNGNCGTPAGQLQDLYYGVQNGTLQEFYLQRAVKRVLKAWFKLGLMDPPITTFDKLTTNETFAEHIDINYEMAVGSIVLLENRNNILPLNSSYFSNNNNIKIGMVGPCIDNLQCFIGDYSENNPPYYAGWITPLQQLNKIIKTPNNILSASGCNETSCNDITNDTLNMVLDVVSKCDIVFYFGGLSWQQETEGHDRTDLQLPGNQSMLFEAIYNKAIVSGKRIISIVSYGAPVIDELMYSKSNAVLGVGYLGQQIGPAVMDILAGNRSPMAKTSITWYKDISQLPDITDYNMKQKPYGRTYRYFTGEPYYTFGYGLSYTKWNYSQLTLTTIPLVAKGDNAMIQIKPCQAIEVNVTVKNIGNKYTSDEITQIYLQWPSYLVDNAIANHTDNIRLVNFTRSEAIKPGEQRMVSLIIEAEQMVTVTTYDYAYRPVIEPGVYNVYVTDTFDMNYKNMMNAQFEIIGNETSFKSCE